MSNRHDSVVYDTLLYIKRQKYLAELKTLLVAILNHLFNQHNALHVTQVARCGPKTEGEITQF